MSSMQPTDLARIHYPPPPWVQWGSMLISTFLVAAANVEPFIPPPLNLLVLPGNLAMGYVAVSRYTSGSTRTYSEVLAGAIVRYKNRYGPFVTQSGVDDVQAQVGGQAIWNLPRQPWRFAWEFDEHETRVQVWDNVRLVLRITDVPPQTRLYPASFKASILNTVGEQAALIPGTYMLRASPIRWTFQLPPDSPLAYLRPSTPVATMIVKGVADIDALKLLPDE